VRVGEPMACDCTKTSVFLGGRQYCYLAAFGSGAAVAVSAIQMGSVILVLEKAEKETELARELAMKNCH